jgi:NDP-4-keto-2,6-dideoxyhexose 3-C-methyltransferase
VNFDKNLEIIEHNVCRLCSSNNLEEAFSLGEQYINDFVDKDKIKSGIKAPLDLVMCRDCSLIQLRHTAPQEILYTRHYWYRSGVTQTMRDGLRDVAENIERMVELKKDDVVLDIGANDGTLLSSFINKDIITVGCEPANNLINMLNKNAKYVMHDFWSSEAYDKCAREWKIGKAKVITALGMFYDLDDPNKFINDIKETLSQDGIFVAQLMCLASMLNKNDLGNICHEHIEYYSYESLKYMFEKNKLEIFKVEENNINGGSYRIYARHLKNGSISFNEQCSLNDLHDFKYRVDDNRQKCVQFIRDEVSKGKKVYVYGASTKGNVILQYYGLNANLITAAAERSPEKVGKYTIGTGIPIISEDEARKLQPDYFLVLPWAFFNEFYERESEWRKKGGKFIVPLPEFRVV